MHRSYLDVGSNIVKSNTFGANPLKLAGSGLDCKQTIENAKALAHQRRCLNSRARQQLAILVKGHGDADRQLQADD